MRRWNKERNLSHLNIPDGGDCLTRHTWLLRSPLDERPPGEGIMKNARPVTVRIGVCWCHSLIPQSSRPLCCARRQHRPAGSTSPQNGDREYRSRPKSLSLHGRVLLQRSLGFFERTTGHSSPKFCGSGAAGGICHCTEPCLPPRACALRDGSTRKLSDEDRDMV